MKPWGTADILAGNLDAAFAADVAASKGMVDRLGSALARWVSSDDDAAEGCNEADRETGRRDWRIG